MDLLAVFVHHRLQGLRIGRQRSNKGQYDAGPCPHMQFYRQGGNRVKSRYSGIGLLIERRQGIAWIVVTTQPMLSIGLTPYLVDRGIGFREEVCKVKPVLRRQARRARKQKGLIERLPGGLNKQVGKCRMGLIGERVAQRDLKSRHHLAVNR